MIIDTSKADLVTDINNQRLNAYIQFKLLHLESFRKEINAVDENKILISENIPENIGIKRFLRKLLKFEKDHQYKYTKGYKPVASIRIEILLPRKLKLKSEYIRFACKYMQQLNPLKYSLPWLAYMLKRGSAQYMVLLLSEREYINRLEISSYDRNYYRKDGELIHPKGSPRLDKSGKIIREYRMFSKKVRIFTLSKFKDFDRFMEDLKQKYMIALKNMIHQVEERYTIKKKNAKKIWHFYNRKCVTEINHAKQYVEMLCSKALAIERMKVIDLLMDPTLIKSVAVPHAKEINNVFFKFQKRFEKGEFHDKDQLVRKIQYKKVDLETLQQNLDILLKELECELKQIVPTVCMNIWDDQKYVSNRELIGA